MTCNNKKWMKRVLIHVLFTTMIQSDNHRGLYRVRNSPACSQYSTVAHITPIHNNHLFKYLLVFNFFFFIFKSHIFKTFKHFFFSYLKVLSVLNSSRQHLTTETLNKIIPNKALFSQCCIINTPVRFRETQVRRKYG